MIVDLLRNDIGRISQSGSIKVYKLFFIEAPVIEPQGNNDVKI
jgi:anthranilate/para-aminobenzoate synthase component I